jgi:hypothetical protein
MIDPIDRAAALDAIAAIDMEIEDGDGFNYAKWCDYFSDLPSAERKTFHVIDMKTGKEADPCEIALKEEWANGLIYCDMEGFAIEEDGSLILLDECGRHAYAPIGRFKVVWDD